MNSAGNIWQANTSAFAIHETTYAGDTLRTIQLDRDAPKLEGRERDSIAAAAGIATRRLPERKHAIETIRTSPDGWVWIETERGATRAWEVFDERGYYMGRVVPPVPIEKQPFPFFGAGTVTGVTLGELDVPYVVQAGITGALPISPSAMSPRPATTCRTTAHVSLPGDRRLPSMPADPASPGMSGRAACAW